MTLNINNVREGSQATCFLQNFIKLSLAVHELSCYRDNIEKTPTKHLYVRRYRGDSKNVATRCLYSLPSVANCLYTLCHSVRFFRDAVGWSSILPVKPAV